MKRAIGDPHLTVLNVLREFDGGRGMSADRALRASKATLDKFGEEINEFWSTWVPPTQMPDDLTIYTGSTFAGTRDGKPANQDLLAGLLYYPKAIVSDPLSEVFETDRDQLQSLPKQPRGIQTGVMYFSQDEYTGGLTTYWKQPDADERRHGLANTLRSYEAVEPLIQAGIIATIPSWRIVREQQAAIAEAMIEDFEDDTIYELVKTQMLSVNAYMQTGGPGSMFTSPGLTPMQLRESEVTGPSFYFNKLITLANVLGARYVPRYRGDSSYLRIRLNRALDAIRSPTESRVLADLSSLSVPEFTELDAATLITIRDDESAFAAFRSELNTLFTTAGGISEQELYPSAVQDYLNDSLAARVAEVRRLQAKNRSLRGLSSVGMWSLSVGAVGTLSSPALAGMVGHPEMTPAVAAASMTGAGAQAALQIIQAALGRSKMEGANLVFAGLIAAQD